MFKEHSLQLNNKFDDLTVFDSKTNAKSMTFIDYSAKFNTAHF